MTKRGLVIFFVVFVIVVTLFQVLILNTPFGLNIVIWAVASGIIATGVTYFIQKYLIKKVAWILYHYALYYLKFTLHHTQIYLYLCCCLSNFL